MSFEKMVQPNSSASLTGFGSTMHGGIRPPPSYACLIYRNKLVKRREISVKQVDYYYIQKKALQRHYIVYRTTSESERIQARLKWKKIDLFNEYNKIDFSPKVKE